MWKETRSLSDYEEKVYRGSDCIYSPLFTQIDLTVERVLQAMSN